MWAWVDRLGIGVLDAAASAAVLLAVVALALIVTRQPARRLQLARTAVLGLLALVPLQAFGLVPRLELRGLARSAGLSDHPLWSSRGTPRAGASREFDPAPPRPADDPAPSWQGWTSHTIVPRGLVLLYLAGLAGAFAWTTIGYLGLAWVARRARAPNPDTEALHARLLQAEGWLAPGLRVSDRIRGPVLIGLLRQTILIPPELELEGPAADDRGALRLALLHELAHAEARDPWFTLAGHLAQTVWYPLPPVWWVVAQMRLDQEFLADRRAVVGFGPPGDYAASLLDFAATRSPAAHRAMAPPPGRAEEIDPGLDPSPLVQRVLMLIRCPFPVEARPPLLWSWGLPSLVVLATLVASSLSLRSGPTVGARIAASPSRRDFRMAQLDLPARPAGSHGRAPEFELPIRLPERFELTVEVLADPASLEKIRVAGLPLHAPIDRLDRPSVDPPTPTWHLVRIVRDGRVSVWVDDHLGPATLEPSALTPWLSVEPAPAAETQFRRLVLSW